MCYDKEVTLLTSVLVCVVQLTKRAGGLAGVLYIYIKIHHAMYFMAGQGKQVYSMSI